MKDEKRTLVYLEKREVYLLEKFIEKSKKGKEKEVLREMEWEVKDREIKKIGAGIGRRAFLPGFLIILVFIFLMSIFSLNKRSECYSSLPLSFGEKKSPILLSYFFNVEYLELYGYDWGFVDDALLSKLKFATFYISIGGEDREKVRKILRELLLRTQDWRVKSRIFHLFSLIYYSENKKAKALSYARKSLSEIKEIKGSRLSYDPLTLILRILFEEGKYKDMEKYIDISSALLNRDFYYPLFKYTAFFLMEEYYDSPYYMSGVINQIERIMKNFPSNLSLSYDFLSVLEKGDTPIFLYARALVYKSLGYRERVKKMLRAFLKKASLNPARYSTLIVSARRMLNAI